MEGVSAWRLLLVETGEGGSERMWVGLGGGDGWSRRWGGALETVSRQVLMLRSTTAKGAERRGKRDECLLGEADEEEELQGGRGGRGEPA